EARFSPSGDHWRLVTMRVWLLNVVCCRASCASQSIMFPSSEPEASPAPTGDRARLNIELVRLELCLTTWPVCTSRSLIVELLEWSSVMKASRLLSGDQESG